MRVFKNEIDSKCIVLKQSCNLPLTHSLIQVKPIQVKLSTIME